jgi:hypothetical protein
VRTAWLLIASVGTFVACSTERSRGVVVAPVQQAQSHPSAEPGPAPQDASHRPPDTATTPFEQANACIMLYECGCNAGCLEIDHPAGELRVGMRVGVLSGALEGTKVFVEKKTTAVGDRVFTVQRRDPDSPIEICRQPGPLVGYLCGSDDLGPARACRSCNGDGR